MGTGKIKGKRARTEAERLAQALAEPLATALSGPVADLEQSATDLTGVAADLGFDEERTRDAAAQVALGCDDGHLFLSSKFTFLLGKLVTHYQAAVEDQTQPADVRAKLVHDFSRISGLLRKQTLARAARYAQQQQAPAAPAP